LSACNSEDCDCKKPSKLVTGEYQPKPIMYDDINGFTWYVGFNDKGGAGSWEHTLKDAINSCMREVLRNEGVKVREIKIVPNKWKDRMNME
jgi:hypothetical protein